MCFKSDFTLLYLGNVTKTEPEQHTLEVRHCSYAGRLGPRPRCSPLSDVRQFAASPLRLKKHPDSRRPCVRHQRAFGGDVSTPVSALESEKVGSELHIISNLVRYLLFAKPL